MTHANRGRFLEEMIEQANQVYHNKGLAVITKIPTPWKVKRRFSPYTRQYQISTAFPEKKSTVDFGGTASNQSIWFDVKAVSNKTCFPFSNIHKHQIEYLKAVAEQGGKAFLLIHSSEMKKTWLLWIDELMDFMKTYDRKSIPFTWFEANCEEIKQGNGVALNYLPAVLKRNEGQR